ncbi:hypothetical protein AGMMS49928_09210 [Spirochaetia bacterium]|nr:hypothetical protein AGMMS49928_09210 [Spirochaetia bacterium]
MDMKHQGRIKDMPIEEKLALLPDTDKAYLRGYLDRTLFEARRNQTGNHTILSAGHKNRKEN